MLMRTAMTTILTSMLLLLLPPLTLVGKLHLTLHTLIKRLRITHPPIEMHRHTLHTTAEKLHIPAGKVLQA